MSVSHAAQDEPLLTPRDLFGAKPSGGGARHAMASPVFTPSPARTPAADEGKLKMRSIMAFLDESEAEAAAAAHRAALTAAGAAASASSSAVPPVALPSLASTPPVADSSVRGGVARMKAELARRAAEVLRLEQQLAGAVPLAAAEGAQRERWT